MQSQVVQWSTLPAELRLAVAGALDTNDIKILSNVDRNTYEICVPFLFESIIINDFASLLKFMDNVPRAYCRHIKHLEISTLLDPFDFSSSVGFRTETVISILLASPCLSSLTLCIGGSLSGNVLAPFPHFLDLKELVVKNLNDETESPLSERLVVSMAGSIPRLETISLDRISRSQMHAPELEGLYPTIPVVINDDDIPDHPKLGSELSLPSLLLIPTLRELHIRDTHLGDSRWSTTPVACRLQIVDLGSCYHESEEFNSLCTERIMSAVGRTVDEFSLMTAVSDATFAKPSATPLPRLRKLHISPFFPVDSVVDTVSNLSGSPIESLSMQCYEDDVVDLCSALEEFLNLRVERGPNFYEKLSSIQVTVAANEDFSPTIEEREERIIATKHLQDFCHDLRLATAIEHVTPSNVLHGRKQVTPLFERCSVPVGCPDMDCPGFST